MPMAPCKHLDYDEAKYGQAAILREIEGLPCPVKYWERKSVWTAGGNPRDVQFCGMGRGRINGIFQCYNPGEMSCYEAENL